MNSILGVDLALNHAGFVMLDHKGGIDRHLVVTEVASAAKGKERAVLFKKVKSEDRQVIQLARLQWWTQFLLRLIREWEPTHVVVEDYAIRAESNAAYQIGEQGGAIRLAALAHGCKLRLHDPMSVKIYGANSGSATGTELADVASERWKLNFKSFNPPKTAKGQNTVPEEDLCAAYVLAHMGWTEIEVREGRLSLSSLDEKQIQVFNRVTKSYPTSLLGREWLTRGAE